MNNIIISYYKDPKTGLSINNTYRNLKNLGHNFTLRQIEESIKTLMNIIKLVHLRNKTSIYSLKL